MDTLNNCNCAPNRPGQPSGPPPFGPPPGPPSGPPPFGPPPGNRPTPPPPPPPPPPTSENITQGRIVDIDRRSRSFTVVSDRGSSSIIRFNLARNARVYNIFGRPMEFADLMPGLRVRVRHADFMTNSIPPQTTAFEVRVIR